MTNQEQLQKKDLIAVRGPLAQDVPFILSTWLRGSYYGFPKDAANYVQNIPKNIYFPNMEAQIKRLLTQPNTTVAVACLKDDPETILGYSVTEKPDILHWVFVKSAWRQIGIAKDLIPQSTKFVTNITKLALSIKPESWIFNPFLGGS